MVNSIRTGWKAAKFRYWGPYNTLKALFNEDPEPLQWRKVKAMLTACRVRVNDRPPTAPIRLQLDGTKEDIYLQAGCVREPAIRVTRNFLQRAGVTPNVIWDYLARVGAPSE